MKKSENSAVNDAGKRSRRAFTLALIGAFILVIAKIFSTRVTILSIVIVAGPISAAAIILGIKSIRQTGSDEESKADRRLAVLAVVIGSLVALGLLAALGIMMLYIFGGHAR